MVCMVSTLTVTDLVSREGLCPVIRPLNVVVTPTVSRWTSGIIEKDIRSSPCVYSGISNSVVKILKLVLVGS